MLESIALRNFQVHEDLIVEFSPTITTIKGPTDKGKSAVLRALRWVCLNDVAGADFIREGAKRVTITLHVTDGKGSHSTISRSKSTDGHVNLYVWDDREFKAFGQSVPPDIAHALALNEINFQGQHDPPFWFADTAGEVSRKLNAVIDLTIIDTALSNIASEVRRAQERKGLCEERLTEAAAQLEFWLPKKDRIAEFQALKKASSGVVDTDREWNRLTYILEQIGANQKYSLAAKAEDGSGMLKEMLDARRLQRDFGWLQGLIVKIAQLQATRPPPDFLPVQQAWSNWVNTSHEAAGFARLVAVMNGRKAQIEILTTKLQQAEAKFHKEIQGKACPLCGVIGRYTI